MRANSLSNLLLYLNLHLVHLGLHLLNRIIDLLQLEVHSRININCQSTQQCM